MGRCNLVLIPLMTLFCMLGPVFMCRWLMNLNEYGVCLLTNLSTDPGAIKEVSE